MKTQFLIPFKRFIFRTPVFPISSFDKEFEDNQKAVFEEAIYLASPELSEETKKTNLNARDKQKMAESLYKYKTRSCMRCTPFGIFAGCSTGEIQERTEIDIVEINEYQSCARLDMDYLCRLILHIESLPVVQQQIKWFPNETIYEVGGRYRYIEYYYVGTQRKYRISSFDDSSYMIEILKLSKGGVFINSLIEMLEKDDISYEEAYNFICQLIKNQILKSELEIALTGMNPMDLFIKKMKKINGIDDWRESIIKIHRILESITGISKDNISQYETIIDIVKQLSIPFNPKYLFQVDLLIPAKIATVSKTIPDEILKTINFLLSVNTQFYNNNLIQFQDAFYARYESQEIPLLQALDIEIGIGYPVNRKDVETNDLFQGVYFQDSTPAYNYTVNSFQDVLLREIVNAFNTGKTGINLENIDLIKKITSVPLKLGRY